MSADYSDFNGFEFFVLQKLLFHQRRRRVTRKHEFVKTPKEACLKCHEMWQKQSLVGS
jgi:hypothetical protein